LKSRIFYHNITKEIKGKGGGVMSPGCWHVCWLPKTDKAQMMGLVCI
jgi:hypothetical protein